MKKLLKYALLVLREKRALEKERKMEKLLRYALLSLAVMALIALVGIAAFGLAISQPLF